MCINVKIEPDLRFHQSRTQNPLALWPAGGRQERLWGTGISVTAGFLR